MRGPGISLQSQGLGWLGESREIWICFLYLKEPSSSERGKVYFLIIDVLKAECDPSYP